MSATFFLLAAAFLFCSVFPPLAQAAACPGIEPANTIYFIFNGGDDGFTCNIDPSQENYGLAYGIAGDFCETNDTMTVLSNVVYTGIDGSVTTALGTPTAFPPTASTTIFQEFTNVPYSSLAPGSNFALQPSVIGGGQTTGYEPLTFTQNFVSTIFYTDTTITSIQTVPSLSTTTSTVTNTDVEAANPTTTTVVTASGVATSLASPTTTTVTSTHTAHAATKTVFKIEETTTHLSCLPSSSAVQRRSPLSARRVEGIQRRQTVSNQPSSYLLDYCGDSTISTTYTTSTSFEVDTVTSGVETVIDYDSTTVTSTYTPTETAYLASPSATSIVTPTLTATSKLVLHPPKKTDTFTSVMTVTRYPKHAKPCSQSSGAGSGKDFFKVSPKGSR